MRRKLLLFSLLLLMTSYFTIGAYGISNEGNSSTGTIKFNKSSYSGIYSTAVVTLKDQDLNLRDAYRDMTRIRVTSTSDPQGFVMELYETGANTATFSGIIKFSSSTTDSSRQIIKVNAMDNILAAYIDEKNSNGDSYVTITASAGFQYTEAQIKTSAADDAGTGSMLDITITEPDANNPNVRDYLTAKVGTGRSTDDMVLRFEESGTNTGIFKRRLYFNDKKTTWRSLQVASSDIINIKYVDQTVPQRGQKEIVKTIAWTYQSTILSMDKEVYIGYTSPAKITLVNMNLNKDTNKTDYVDVKVTSHSSNGIRLTLRETSKDSGEFTGNLYFGETSSSANKVIKAVESSGITISYVNKREDDDFECYADWSPQDGQLTLDRDEYIGNDTPVRITLVDADVSDDINNKDEVRVNVGIKGNSKRRPVTLTETGKSSGIFTGILYINAKAGNRPSIDLNPNEILEVIYTDENTISGDKEDKKASATWAGVSKAVLILDKAAYVGYDTNMVINLNDPDQNKSTTSRDKVEVVLKTKNGKTNAKYTLTETGNNTGIFTLKLKLTKDTPNSSRIRVSDRDEIEVSFREKNTSVSAGFGK